MEKVKKFIVDACLQAKEKGLQISNNTWGVAYSSENDRWELENSLDEANKCSDIVCPLGAVLLTHGKMNLEPGSGTPHTESTVLNLLKSKFPEEMKDADMGHIEQFITVIDDGVKEDSSLAFEQLALDVSKEIGFKIQTDISADDEEDEEDYDDDRGDSYY